MKNATITTLTLVLAPHLVLFGCAMSNDVDTSNIEAPETSPVAPTTLATAEQCYVVADVGETSGEDVLFIVDKTDSNPATNLRKVASVGANSVEAIAFNPETQVLYAADSDQLGTIDLATGAFQPLAETFGKGPGASGELTFKDVDGLSFDPTTGKLYGSVRRETSPNQPDLLIVIDPATGAHVASAFGPGIDYVVIPAVEGNLDIDDLAIDIHGQMFAIANTGGRNDRLVTIDKNTGKATDVGATVINDIEGLAFDPTGQLWGSAGKNKTLYRLDTISGEASNAVPLALEDFTDFEALACMTVTTKPTCETNPELAECNVKPPVVDPTLEYSVTGGGCSASLHSSTGTGLALLFALVVLGLGRRRRGIAS
jgi:hypothetical protein